MNKWNKIIIWNNENDNVVMIINNENEINNEMKIMK